VLHFVYVLSFDFRSFRVCLFIHTQWQWRKYHTSCGNGGKSAFVDDCGAWLKSSVPTIRIAYFPKEETRMYKLVYDRNGVRKKIRCSPVHSVWSSTRPCISHLPIQALHNSQGYSPQNNVRPNFTMLLFWQ